MANTNLPDSGQIQVANLMLQAYLAAPSYLEERFRALLLEYLSDILYGDFNALRVLKLVESSGFSMLSALRAVLED